MINPFSIPGDHPDDPIRPLCPWDKDTREHAEYYADIDHMEDSFAQFIESMANISGLLKAGRLVVVAGGKGCGKTSLINRCAHWLQTEARNAGQGLMVEVVPLTAASDSTKNVTERMTAVGLELADEVKVRNLATDDALADVVAGAGVPATVYRRLSRVLHEQMIVALLLPPIELVPLKTSLSLVNEIRDYTRFAYPKLVFFLEVTLAEDPNDLASLLTGAPTRPIVLPVRPLKPGDGLTFASVRLNLHANGEVFPQLELMAQEKLVEKNRSVRFVQGLLYSIYEERKRAANRYTNKDLVTYDDIAKFVLEHIEGDVPGMRF